MKKYVLIVILLFASLCSLRSVPVMNWLQGPEDGLTAAFDYNEKSGLMAALIIKEYDITLNKDTVATITELKIKSINDKQWKVIRQYPLHRNFNNFRLEVFDNGTIKISDQIEYFDNYSYSRFYTEFSTDMGKTWGGGFYSLSRTSDFAVKNNKLFYLCINELQISADNGATWTKSKLPGSQKDFPMIFYSYGLCAVTDNNTIFAQSRCYHTGGPALDSFLLYKSVDNGSNWTKTGSNLRAFLNELLFVDDNHMFGFGKGIHYSADGGNSFQQIGLGDKNFIRAKFTDDSRKTILAATSDELYLINTSTNAITKIEAPTNKITGISAQKGSIIFADFNNGAFISQVSNISWKTFIKPVSALSYKRLLIDNSGTIYVTTKSLRYNNLYYEIYKSANRGENWERIWNYTDKYHPWLISVHDKLFIHGTDLTVPRSQKLYRYVNNSFELVYSQFGDKMYGLGPYGDNLIIMANGNGNLSTSDNGTTWLPTDKSALIPYYISENGELLVDYFHVFRYYDKFHNLLDTFDLSHITITVQSGNPRDGFTYYEQLSNVKLFIDDSLQPVAFEYDNTGYEMKSNFYYSYDKGKTWIETPIKINNISTGFSSIIQNRYNQVYLTIYDGLYHYDNKLKTIEKVADYPSESLFSNTLSDFSITDIKHDWDGNIYLLVPNYGILTYNANQDLPDKSADFDIDVFPNPIKQNAEVTFNVPKDGSKVSIKLYDMSGSLVEQLYSGVLDKGKHSIDIIINKFSKMSIGSYLLYVCINDECDGIRVVKE